MAENNFLRSPLDTVTDSIKEQKFELPELPEIKAPEKTKEVAAKDTKQTAFLPPQDFMPIFEASAREFDVPINVLMALGHQESRYNPNAIGQPTQWGRAKGVMQYLDGTASSLGINPFDPTQAIPAAAKQLRERLDKGYSMEDAVKEHFAGPDRKKWGEKTAVYGREVLDKAGRIGELMGGGATGPAEAPKQKQDEPGRYVPLTQEQVAQFEAGGDPFKLPEPKTPADQRGFLDRAGEAISTGYDNMKQSLATARFAVAGGDSAELAKALSQKFQREAAREKTTGEKEIDAAFQNVTDAKGTWDTLKAGAKAVGTAFSNPKDLAVGVIEQAPNMLPTLAGGAGGAGAGGATGAGVGSVFGGVGAVPGAVTGAIWGSRAGMVAGTTATELGAEVEQMVLERLQQNKAAPTAQNIQALLDDKAFQSDARERGLKKGLTVGLIDQIFLGLGGKVATAPTRRAAKTGVAPSVASRVGAGAAAVGLDAVGETTGEAASQYVARGTVDAGDALREGVYGLGQSVVEPAIGASMEAAKRAVLPSAPAATAAAPEAAPATPAAPVEVATVTPPEPSQASGPLTRAVENAAEHPARVTVSAPQGEISGFVQSHTEDSQGNAITRVLGDDGQVYTFTSADGVQIKPEAGPLSKSLEQAAEKSSQEPAPAAPAVDPVAPVAEKKAKPAAEPKKPAAPEQAPAPETIDLTNRTEQQLQYLTTNGNAGFKEAAVAELKRRALAVPEPRLEDMTEADLRARLKYLAKQAKMNGGWNKMLNDERRKVESRINKIAEQKPQSDLFTGESNASNADAVRVRDDGVSGAEKAAQGKGDQQGNGAGNRELAGLERSDAGALQVGNGNDLPAADATANADKALSATEKAKQQFSDVMRKAESDAKAEAAQANDAHAGKWFGSREKADAYIAKKKIIGSHEVVQTGKVRWEVRPKQAVGREGYDTPVELDARELQKVLETSRGEPLAEKPEKIAALKVGAKGSGNIELAFRDRDGKLDVNDGRHRIALAAEQGKTVTAFIDGKDAVRLKAQFAEATPAAVNTSVVDREQNAEAAPAGAQQQSQGESNGEEGQGRRQEEVLSTAAAEATANDAEKSREPDGIRLNGEAEKAAADLLQRLLDAMPASMKPLAQGARQYVKSTVEELSKEKTATSVIENLETASDRFTRAGHAPFADVIDEVIASLQVKAEEPVKMVDKRPVKTGDSMADYLANSAGASIERDINAGRSKVVDLAGEQPTEPPPPKGGKKDPFAGNKIFTSDKVAAARARMKSKLGQLNSGIDPELMMDGMTIAGAYIESGVRSFADYAKAMTEDFGEKIKPYLLSFYEAARNYPGIDTEGMSTVDEAKAQHAALLTPAVAEQVKDVVGEPVEKPAKRTKKTGSKTDMTLTQDWGVDHVDGYGDNPGREEGNSVKDAFLKEARAYLNAVASVLTENGYLPQKDRNGRDMKPVGVNESGVATSGDVSLTMYHPDGGGIYAQIGGTSLRGVVPTTTSGISIMFRQASEQDKYGTKSTNRWAPTDLSAADLAIMLDKEAKRAPASKPAQEALPSTTQIAETAAAPILEEEGNANDTQPTQAGAGDRAEGPAAGAVRQAEGERDAGGNAGADRRTSGGVDRGSAAASDRGGDDRGDAGVRGRSDAADADAQQPVQGGRGDGDAAGGRGSEQPRSGVANYRIQPGELKRDGSWRATAERNVQIVELVKAIAAEGRQAKPEERALLAKFTGWGASEIANGIFPDRWGRYKNAEWQALGQRLKAALTEEEYAQARRTTQYAHYTSEGVIRAIYSGVQRLGFAGGSVLEPGMGVGHFNGLMPDGMAANSRYTGIEYDTITGTIAKLLYPQSNIIVGDYTRTNLPPDFFDAAIGNPPFSSTQILSDPEYKSLRPMLHDYFFMKTIDRVKPGGVLVFVTSKGTMDKASDKSRKYLAERANLLGAVRLPQTAFKDNAGTEVVTDVIFLQKRGPGIADNGVQWLGTKTVDTKDGPASINEYFADHPEMVLGTHSLQSSMYRANEYTVLPPAGDIEDLFAKAVQNLPENVFRPDRGSAAERAAVQERDYNPKHKKEGGLYLSDDGKLMQVENGSGVEVTHRTNTEGKSIALTPKQRKWLRGYVGLRDALKQAQYDQLNDGDWQKSLKALNKTYDAFVKEHGPILDYTVIERENADGTVTETKRYKNEPLLRIDAEGALAYALEQVKEDGTIVKGAVLNERVLERPRDPEIKTTQDALFVSLNRNGSLVIEDVAALAGTDKESVIRDLGTSIYEAPGAGWQLADEYLSGNVVRKLKEARAASEIEPRYKRNVEALLSVQPRPLGPTDITVRLGANWLPTSDVSAFAEEVLGEKIEITYSPLINKWNVEQRSRNMTEWGFDKMTAGAILDGVLNNRQLKVTWRDSEGKTHVDLESTEKANDIAGKMRDRFRSWIWTDPKRAERLVNYYNENFNNIAPRQFDGSHLTLPGISSRYKLYPHQKRAVWRIVQQGDTYLAHAVGAGKTMEMIAGGMEERRLGLINKPMYVVPNHMLAQFSREFLELYPTASIMVADEHNFHTHNRRRFVAQAALNNPDAIIITHAAFGRIGMSDEFYSDFMQRQIDSWKEALADAEGDRITTKQIERRIEQLEQRLEGRQNRDKKDQVLTFEELGVDKLFVDEFHEFRKLDFATNQGNVKGIDPNGSQRALDLSMKIEYLRGKKPGRALVAASGTPVTNTMGELYTAQRFFQPDQLREDALENFDAWAAQYGDIVTGFEQNAAGGYEMVARFARFQNVPELMRRVRSFMDILTGASLGELVKRPDVIGGGREVIVTPVPDGYKEYQQELQSRIKAIRNRKGPPKKGDDIILNVIGDGRFSAIDMRFVDPSLPSDPNSKLNVSIDNIIAAYRETADWEYAAKDGSVDPLKGSSIVLFTDIGLGEQSAATRGFDMRAWIEKRLTDAGIPREHIAFMRDHKQHAKKERLFADMREGKKRILIGGKEMETGTNVQKRLSHLFHLDAPWFPASVEQREGRIVRQGNQNKDVKISAFATKGSYDSTMWGMNARKARFIEQAMNGDDSVRSLEDVSEASSFEMAAALASGDERYLKLAGLKTDVERLERLRYAHYDDHNRLTREKHWAEETVKRNTARAKELADAIAKRAPIRAGEFSAKIGTRTFDNREEFSQAIFSRFQKLAGEEAMDATVGQIGGFEIKFYGTNLKGGNYAAALHVDLPGDPDPLLTFPLDPEVAVAGIATRAANQVNGLDRQLYEAKNTIESAKAKIEQIGKRLGAVFPEESLLLEKVAELNGLEAELSAESDAANADAAAATAEVQPEPAEPPAEEPRYSVAEDGATVAEFGHVTEAYRDDPAGAIRYLMEQKTGEAIVNHPTLGEISLIYGDGTMGLSHIAARRGDEFIARIADMIENGSAYEKPGQNGRVFLGTDAHEAAIRLDWNGQAKAWLVSAYEKHPDLAAATDARASTRSETVKARTGMKSADLKRAITNGIVGVIVADMIENGLIVLHDSAKTLPAEAKGARGVQAVTLANGQIHLVADALTAENARPVLMHELFHMGGERMVGSREWRNLMGRLGSLYRQSEASSGRAREFFDRARARVAAAKRQGAVSTRMEVEEFGAYAIEEYERAPESLPATIRKWVEDIIGNVKAYLLARYGKQLGDVTPAQLASMARMVLMEAAAHTYMPDSIVSNYQAAGFDGAWNKIGNRKPSLFVVFSPEQVKSATGNNGAFDPANPDIRYSVTPEEADKALAEASDVLDATKEKDDYIGRVVGDISLGAKLLNHPRQVAAIHPEFTPVYRTAISQMETRDKNIADFGADVKAYDHLGEEGKANVNKVLELGRLTSAVFSADELAAGVENTGSKKVVTLVEGKPKMTTVPVTALLTKAGDVVRLSDDEIKAYQDLRSMFDRALDKMRDQTLTEMGFGGFAPMNGTRPLMIQEAGEGKIVLKGTVYTDEERAALNRGEEINNPIRAIIKKFDGAKWNPELFGYEFDERQRPALEKEMADYLKQSTAKQILDLIDKNTPAQQAERLRNIAAFVAEIEQAKRAGYVPFARYGDYVVTVKEKVADVKFLDDGGDRLIAQGIPDSFAADMLDLGAEKVKEGWQIKKSQRQAVERLTEQTIYSAKVETGLADIIDEKRAGKVDDIKAVREAIEKAKSEWIGDNPSRRVVAFKVREKTSDQPVKLSDVDALAEVANIDNATWDAVRDKLSDAIKSKSFRKHFFHSDNVPGYTGDFERSIADYVIGMSGYLSRRQHLKRWENSVTAIKDKPQLYSYASKYRDYVNNPQEELAMVRQIGFFSYIAGVMASAFANLTQVPLLTMPTLAQVAPAALAAKEIARAYKDAAGMLSMSQGLDMFDPGKAPGDVRGILKEAWAEGSFVPLESFDLMMTARQRNVGTRKGVKAFNTTTQVVALAFTFAERMNRLVTFIAAARLAEKRAIEENAKVILNGDALARAEVLRNWNPKSFAEWVVDESQFRMGKANRPTVMRGVGSAIMQFKGFMMQTFEAWYRMAALHGKPGKYAAAASLLALYAFAGVWGLPGADDLRKLIENVFKQITDKDLDLKTELRAWIARTSGSNALALMVSKGAPYPLGVDLTRVGMGSVAPDSPLAAAGIPFDMLIGRPKRAFEKASSGDKLGAAAELTPNFMKHWLVAGSWSLEGVRDKQGNRILLPSELSAVDLAMKSLGFQPSIVTDIRDYEYAERRMETSVDALKRGYTTKLAKAFVEYETTTNPAKQKEIDDRIAGIYADIAEHNASAGPEQIIKIDNRTLRNKIMREAEGVKSTWGRERKSARETARGMREVFGLSPQEDDD